jgi:hypothetical protein
MTDMFLSGSFTSSEFRPRQEAGCATGDFRIGRVLERTASVIVRNFPMFLS